VEVLMDKPKISSKIILNSGNVGLWACLFRGNSKGVYQYLFPLEYICGKKNNSKYLTSEKVWFENDPI
jgi:hypothetical protein